MGFYTESAKQMINPMDVPSFFIECAETERKLFEGLIELDFAEVYKENGLAVFTEEETAAAEETSKKAFKDVVADLVKKFEGALKAAYDAITDKLKELFDKTADLLTKKVLDNPEAAKCDLDVVWYEDYYKKATESLKSVESVLDKMNSDIAKDEEAASKFDEIYAQITEAVGKIPTTVEAAQAENKDLITKMNAHDVKSLAKALSPAGIGSELTGAYNNLKKVDLSHYAIEDSDADAVKERKVKVLQKVNKVKLAYFAAKAKIAMNTANIARNNFVKLASYVKGTKKESAEMYDIMNDILCESILGI